MAQGETGRLLTPISAALAVVLAAGVWFVPFPSPEPSQPAVRIGPGSGTPEEGSSTVRAVGATPDHNWLALVEPLSNLREPIVKIDDDPPPIDRDPTPPPPSFRYLGLVTSEGGKAAALLDIGGTQRFVSVGDVIADPDRDDLVVKDITPAEIVFDRGGVITKIQREARSGADPGAPANSSPPPNQAEDDLIGRSRIR